MSYYDKKDNLLPDKMSAKAFQAVKPKAKRKRKEESLQIQITSYLKVRWPKIVFRSDTAAGIKLTKGQAVKNARMQSGRSYPDLFIAAPRGGFCGLYLELKHSRSEIYLKDDVTLSKSQHIQEQHKTLIHLQQLGYRAVFCCGYDEAINTIDEYLLNH